MSCIELPRPSSLLASAPLCNKPKESDISYQLLLGTSATSVDSDAFSIYQEKGNINPLQPQEVTLNFYAEDGTHQRLVVDENLRVLDLCQLLALKFNVARSHTWTVVEQITPLGIERSLEDHEDILQVYASWSPRGKAGENKFIFKQDFCKYEFFRTPQQFFPLSMVDLGSIPLDCLSESVEIAKLVTLQNILSSGEKSPVVQSLLWCKEPGKDSWKRLFFRIEGSTLCVSSSSSSSYNVKDLKQQLWPFRDLLEYDIYAPIESRCATTPTSYSFCLKLTESGDESSKNLLWMCCESERHKQCWMIALRLAKYGKKIRENYKEVQSRYVESPVSVPNGGISGSLDSLLSDYTPMKPQVAMDFTGSQSRVVDDPREAKAIAEAEGHVWKRRLPCCRAPSGSPQPVTNSPTARPAMELGVHTIQPWFYSGMSRDEATHLLTKYGTVDGVFLVRESRRNPGSFVLSYVYNHKVHHCQIFQVEEKDQLCYSLDNGRTKFYDLLQLVEFYQLNLGSLPSKLTHFLVHRPRANGQQE